jgi:hypothetical protein
MAPKLTEELDWDRKLHFKRGGSVRLAGIRVYYEFKWRDLMADGRAQFRNGQCLAERVRADCPAGKEPALLLTDRDDVDEGAIVTASFYVVVLNLPRYLAQAEANAAVSYLAKTLGPITQVKKLQDLAAVDSKDLRALIQLNLNATDIAAWVRGNDERGAQLRDIIAEGSDVKAAALALRSLSGLDTELVEAFCDLVRTEPDRDKRLSLLRAMTEDHEGRSAAAEVLSERVEDRLSDARDAVKKYEELLEDQSSTETDLQLFFEAHPWLLGLDYARVFPRQQVLRGTVDFLLSRFDGFYDLLELKGPKDPIVVAPTAKQEPPSPSKSALSPALAQALAQVHVYRDALRDDQVSTQWFGLSGTRDPCVTIVLGTSRDLSDMSKRILHELNCSLHRVEIVPYDIIGQRASATLEAVARQLVAVADTVPTS